MREEHPWETVELEWSSLGDPVATSIMLEGLRLDFVGERPPLHMSCPAHLITSGIQEDIILSFIPGWLDSGYVKEIFFPTPLHFSRMFTVPKGTSERRPILDLSPLNLLLKRRSFRMEDLMKVAKCVFSGSLGSEARPQRCILQHLAERSGFEIPRFRPGKSHFHLPSPSIRTLHGPLGIHKGYEAYQEETKASGYSDLVVSRRFPNPSFLLQGGSGAHSYCNRSASEARFGNKLGKVFPSPNEEIGVLVDHSRPGKHDLWASR